METGDYLLQENGDKILLELSISIIGESILDVGNMIAVKSNDIGDFIGVKSDDLGSFITIDSLNLGDFKVIKDA